MTVESVQSQSCCGCILFKLRAAYDKIKEIVIAIFRALFCLNLEAPKKLKFREITASPELSPRIQMLVEILDMSLDTNEPESPKNPSPQRTPTPVKSEPEPARVPSPVPAPVAQPDAYQEALESMQPSPPRTSPVKSREPSPTPSLGGSWVDPMEVLTEQDAPPM